MAPRIPKAESPAPNGREVLIGTLDSAHTFLLGLLDGSSELSELSDLSDEEEEEDKQDEDSEEEPEEELDPKAEAVAHLHLEPGERLESGTLGTRMNSFRQCERLKNRFI